MGWNANNKRVSGARKKVNNRARASKRNMPIHEAGHAVMDHYVGCSINKVSLRLRHRHPECLEIAGKKPEISAPESIKNELEKLALPWVGGLVAEHIANKRRKNLRNGAGRKDIEALQPIKEYYDKMGITPILKQELGIKVNIEWIASSYAPYAEKILRERWKAVTALAHALMEKKSLDGEEATRIIEANL